MEKTVDIATWEYLGSERRQGDRKLFRSPAQLLLPSRELQRVRTLDISVGGIGLVASTNLPLNAVCEIKFRTPVKSDRIEMLLARGRVAYSILSGKENGFLVGLQFTDIPPASLALIKRYMNPA